VEACFQRVLGGPRDHGGAQAPGESAQQFRQHDGNIQGFAALGG
jgi:hypothetical protein